MGGMNSGGGGRLFRWWGLFRWGEGVQVGEGGESKGANIRGIEGEQRGKR